MLADSTQAPDWFGAILSDLLERRNLQAEQMGLLMHGMLSDRLTDTDRAAALIALRMKGETAEELAVAARVLREHAVVLDPRRPGVLDTCGTGGDGLSTFNISTATAFVVAAAGVPVVKHGNRAVSSTTGSADVLAVLGVSPQADPHRCLDAAQMAFCLAPLYHPAVGAATAAVRRRLGVRTVFNALGPLCNPASAPYQLLGVGRAEWLDPMAQALAQLGVRRAALVHADDGLDEVSLTAPTQVRLVQGETVMPLTWTAADFGLPGTTIAQLQAADANASAAIIRAILAGHGGPTREVVLANAAAALWVAGVVANLREGVQRAAQAIDSGGARRVLDALVEISRQDAPTKHG
jgi:anthranilate phosphoribosyltransferase